MLHINHSANKCVVLDPDKVNQAIYSGGSCNQKATAQASLFPHVASEEVRRLSEISHKAEKDYQTDNYKH